MSAVKAVGEDEDCDMLDKTVGFSNGGDEGVDSVGDDDVSDGSIEDCVGCLESERLDGPRALSKAVIR